MRIDLYVHQAEEDEETLDKITRVAEESVDLLTKLVAVQKKMEALLMGKADELKASVDALTTAFNDATDEVAKDLSALRQQVADGLKDGLTAAEADALKADLDNKLGAAAARLTELGKDPENPVPAPSPEPPPV